MRLPYFWVRRLFPCACLLAGMLGLVLHAAAQEPVKDKSKDIIKVPGKEETGPTPPVEPTPTPPTPTDQIPQGIRAFTFPGSPRGQFDFTTPSLSGAPTDMFNSPRSVTTLDQARIEQQAPSNTPSILQGIPGVRIQRTNAGGGSLIIRGYNGNQNLIMIDGVPINDSGWRAGNVQYLNMIDPGSIERVEVIRGPASVLYGSGALGGVLNVITKGRRDFSETIAAGGGISTRYGTALHDPYNRVEFQGNFLNFGYFMGGSLLQQGAVSAGQGAYFSQFATAYDQNAADIRLDWLAAPRLTFTFVFQHMFQNDVPRTDRFPLAVEDPLQFVNIPTNADQTRDFGYLRLSFVDEDSPLINGFQMTGWVQRREERTRELQLATRPAANPFGPLTAVRPRLRLDSEEVNYGGFEARGYTRIPDLNTLSYGFTYMFDTINSIRLQQRAASVAGTLLNRPIDQITPPLPDDGKYIQLGIFLYDTLEITDWFALNAGGRWSNVQAEGTAGFFNRPPPATNVPVPFERHFLDWVGEVGAVLRLTENLHWVTNIAEGFRAPNLDDLAASDKSHGFGQDFGVTTLDTERVISYETGAKYRGERLAGAATYYWIKNQELVVRTPVPGTGNNTRTNDQGFSHGVELEGQFLLLDNLALFMVGSQSLGQDQTAGMPLSRWSPAYAMLGSRWTYRAPSFGLFTEAYAELSGRQTRLSAADLNDIRIPVGGTQAWQTFNLRTGIDGAGLGRLTLGLYNIFDQNYRVHGSGVDSPGIEFRVGYDLTY